MRGIIAFFVWIVLALAAVSPARAEPLDVAGVWRSQNGEGRIEIRDCGDGGPCGRIVSGRPGAPGSGSAAGELLWGFQKTDEGWSAGRLRHPRTGLAFSAKLRLLDQNRLKVSGCLGPACGSQIWTREP